MLSILGNSYRLCDGLTRRAFLQVGGLAVGGLSLPQVLRAEEQAGVRSNKSVIMVFLPGGPSHIDLFDMKPAAPAEFRGEYKPIHTRVPGIDICEHLPRLAACMDRLALIRTIVGGPDDHACHMPLAGRNRNGPQPAGGWPTFSSFVSKVLGPVDPAVPPVVNLARPMIHGPYNDPGPGFLGAAHAAFTPDGESRAQLAMNRANQLHLSARGDLLAQFDQLRRGVDTRGVLAGMDVYKQKALNLLTSSRLRDALDLSREDPKTRDLYGKGNPELITGYNAAPRLTQDLLLARRLVEAGVRCVTVAFGAWDWHDGGFKGLMGQMPYLDQGIAALVTDLQQRGLDKDVSVIVWGEFGRSPRISKSAGRDHWPAVSCALLAGAGRMGQVVGVTNRYGEVPKERPVHWLEVMATLYHRLGIDTSRTTVTDLSGRPQFLVDEHRPIAELV